jgi:hypothetical protein
MSVEGTEMLKRDEITAMMVCSSKVMKLRGQLFEPRATR